MPKRVLIAEDEPHIVESLSFLLDRAGFEVAVAVDGEAALSQVAAAVPDVVVLDLMLPEVDGLEVLRRLRADPATAELPVLMLTARGQREDRESARRWGADAFISKPFSNSVVVDTVARLAGSEGRRAKA